MFPAAVSGIVASLILGFSRAIGETMVVAIAAGATGAATRHWNPLEPGQTMTGAIASLAIGSDQVKSVRGLNPFDALYFVGLLLFVMTLGLNLLSRAIRPPRAEGLLMATIAPTAQVRGTVELALRGQQARSSRAASSRQRCCCRCSSRC